ncbi:MAG: hypothetical protein EAZ27_11900 [Cytophagales bacterium]|nr:MAG: hypothetical protein EAZ27_11900 [Cytophagales bacterium]
MRKKYTLLLLFFFLVSFLSNAEKTFDLCTISQIYDAKTTDGHLTYLKKMLDGNGFENINNHVFNQHNKSHWLKFRIKNKTNEITEKVLSFGYTNEYIIIYQFINNQIVSEYKCGLLVKKSQKNIVNNRGDFSRIFLPANSESTFLININNEGLFSKQLFSFSFKDFKLYDTDSYLKTFSILNDVNLMFYGAIVVMFLYTISLAISLKSRAYFYYSIYIILFAFFNSFTDGILLSSMSDFMPILNKMLRFLVVPIMVISFLQFSRIYLNTGENTPKTDKAILITMLLLMLTYVLFFKSFWMFGRNYLLVVVAFGVLLTVFAALQSMQKGKLPSYYYLLGTFIVFFSCMIYMLYMSSIVPHNIYTKPIEYIIQLASMLELCVFSVGLSARIKIVERDLVQQRLNNEKEKQQLIEEKSMELKYKVLESTRELRKQKDEIAAVNEHLEEKVRERTKKLQKAYRDLLNLNYELDSFIYRAAHDIRGPITTIMGLCNITLLETDPKKIREYLLILDKYSHSTQITLNRILSVNDLKNNPVKYSFFNLQELTESVSTLLLNNQDRSKVNIQYELPNELTIYSDFKLLEIILLNLIDNSIRFRTTNKNSKPYCRTIIQSSEEEIIFTVIDNGDGIDDNIKVKVFDMFFRGSEYASGSGLGLYISKIAAKRLGGDVHLISSIQGETIFELTIPIIKEKPQKKLAEMALLNSKN